MNLQVIKIKELDSETVKKVDMFILDKKTNGEFINTIKYISYHRNNKFIDESIVIIDIDCGAIKCMFLSAIDPIHSDIIVSHPGTTFAGLVYDEKVRISDLEIFVDLIEKFYKESYKMIIIKNRPICYSIQPNDELNYHLMKKKYKYSYSALANVINLYNINNDDEIFLMYHSKRRNQVRKSLKTNQFTLFELDIIESNIWKDMNQKLKDKFDSKTTHSHFDICYLKKIFPNNISVYEVRTKNNTYGAFALVYKFKNVFHTQYLDMNYQISSEYPNLFLIHQLIKIAIKEGFMYFSFGSSTENGGDFLNESLYNYKNEFGGGSILLSKLTKEI